MQNVVGPTLVAMAMTFGLGAESNRLPACLIMYSADDDLSSISGSESASSDSSDSESVIVKSESSRHRGRLSSRQSQQLLLRNSAGQLISIQRCVVNVHNVRIFVLHVRSSVHSTLLYTLLAIHSMLNFLFVASYI